MLSHFHSFMCTHSVSFRCYFKHFNSVKTLGFRFHNFTLLHVNDLSSSLLRNSSMNNVNDSSVVNLATIPFKLIGLSLLVDHSFNRPVGLRHKLLNLLSLVNAKAKCRCLTRTISDHSELGSKSPKHISKVLSLIS